MKFSETQFVMLRMLHHNGGRATLKGSSVVTDGWRSGAPSAGSFLHLVAKGTIDGKDGYLRLTDYGYRVLGERPPPRSDDEGESSESGA